MKIRKIDTKWFSWIPTNLGYLNYNYIADRNNLECVFGKNNFEKTKTAKDISIFLRDTHLSDINEIAALLLEYDEVLSTAKLRFEKKDIFNETIQKNQPIGICGEISIDYANVLTMNATFDIHTNGSIVIEAIALQYDENTMNDPDLNVILSNTIANAMYTLIKKIVHGDKHHHQKIDTIIGVYTKFDPKQILTDLGFQIKRLEKYVKAKNNTASALMYNSAVEETHNTAMGFMSYIRTFHSTFIKVKDEDEKSTHISLSGIENVISSIKSIVNRNNNETAHSNKIILLIVTLIALFASLNIFYATLIDAHQSSIALSMHEIIKSFLSKHEWLVFLSSRDILIGIIFLFILMLFLIAKNAMGYYGAKWLGSKIKYSLYEVYILARYLNTDEELIKEYKNDVSKIKHYKTFIQGLVLSIPLSLFGMIIGVLTDYYLAMYLFLCLLIVAVFLFFIKIVK